MWIGVAPCPPKILVPLQVSRIARVRAKAASTAGPRDAGRKRGWAEKRDTHYERAAIRHRFRIAAWSFLFLALVAGFIVWLAWKPLRTPVLVAVVTDCPFPLPPNSWAKEDMERLQTLDRQEVLKCISTPWESKESGIAELRRQLAAAQPGGPKKDLIILYLSMPGAVDGQAEPCLIPPGASPWKSDQWLRVRDLLGQLFSKENATGSAAKVKHLLILDAGRMGANWDLGLPYNSFADRLQDVLQEMSIPNLFVLNSAGPGQIGWAAPELKGSVFGYFLWQGLHGAADIEASGNRDKVVSLQELVKYLKAYVGQWVTENRSELQEPMLFPADADFPVVFRYSTQPSTLPELGDADPRWPQIAALWEKHEELSRNAPHSFQPLAWEEFQQKLLRLEQLVDAGSAYEDEFNDTKKRVETLAAALVRDPVVGDVARYSFPLLRQFDGWPSAAELAAVPGPWKKPPVDAKPVDKPNEKPAEKQTIKPAEKPPDAVRPYAYRVASVAAWEWLLADPAHDRDLPAVLKYLDGAEGRPPHDPIEVHFLRMLAEHLDPPLLETGADRIRRALIVRHLAERAAAPVDARVLYWLQSPMETADQSRREAEDRLFVGSPEALPEADALWKSLIGEDGQGGAYGSVLHRADEIAAAFQLRDRAWAEIPYLAQWFLARRQQAKTADAPLHQAIDGSRALSIKLDAHLADSEWPPEAAASAAQLEGALRMLDGIFQEECAELKTAGADKQTLKRISMVLGVPLLSGRERNRLRDEYLSISRKIIPAGSQYEVAGKEKPAAENEDIAMQMLERLDAWHELPVASILDRAGSPEGPSPGAESGEERPRGVSGAGNRNQFDRELLLKRLARQGADLRLRLSGLPDLVQINLQATSKLLEQKEWQPAKVVRAGDGKADRVSRAAAAFLDDRLRGKLGIDPADSLRRLDLHYLMLWQGNRSADDFWGPAAGQQEPYFAAVARAYGESAEKLRKGVPRWQEAVGILQEAARQGVQPAVTPKNVFVDRNDPAVKHVFSVTVPAHLPKGTAAVYLRDSAGLLPLLSPSQSPLRRLGLAVAEPGKQATPNYLIPNNERLAKDDRLQAVALYRGQERQDDFYVLPATGLDIVYTRPNYAPPTVVVRGEMKQTSTVMFIFDCSGSMGARMVIEGKQTTRLNLARDTLVALLRRLADPKNPFDVGLIAYGHRVGWDPSDPSKIVIRDPRDPHAYRFVPRPPEMAAINPSNDVELMLAPGHFGQEEFNEVSRKVAALENMGETPLYLSIIEAIHNLRNEASAGQRRVVVITDGVNNQTGGGSDIKYREDVEQEFKKPGNEDIRLDVVGFNIEQQEAGLSREETARRLSDLKELAKAHGGAFHDTSDPTTLLKALQRSLMLSEYVVETLPGGRRVTQQPLELNSPCALASPPAAGAGYLVRLIDPDHSAESRVTVEGGEALELFVARNETRGECRLIHHRYTKGLRDSVDKIPAPDDEQKRLFYVAAHLPEWKEFAARFYVSVQNSEAEQFSPRPQEAWIEVRPVGAVGSGVVKEYVFYDVDFLPDCPVPVLTCVTPNWPEAAKDAEIQVWCKLHKTPPSRELTVGDFRRDKPVLEEAPGVSFDLETVAGQRPGDPFQVIVVERHPPGSDLYSVKVEMQPTPERVVHRFNVSTGVIRHTFYYENAAKSEVDNYRVLLTARRKLFEGAIALPRPLRVTVPVD